MRRFFFQLIPFFCLGLCLKTQAQSSGFSSLPVEANGEFYQIQYKIHPNSNSGKKIALKDFVKFHLVTMTESDSVLKTTYPDQPLVKEISTRDYPYVTEGFIKDMLLKLSEGDSATFLVQADDLFEAIKRKRPDFIASGSRLKYVFKILEIQGFGEVKKDEEALIFEQRKIDEKIIARYVAKNMDDAKRTFNGMWYQIHHQGEGDFALEDDVVAIRYTLRLLNGEIIANSDRDGRLFEFPVNKGFVISGLDQALLLLKEGASATFVMPSYLAFGSVGKPGLIPPDTPVIYDIEFLDIVSRKIIIENKGQVLQEEKQRAQKEGISEEEALKRIQKDLRKRNIKVTNKKENQ